MKSNIEALQELKRDLKSADTMEEFLNTCARHYDFKNAKLGTASRIVLIDNIGKVIGLSGAKPK